MNDDNNPIQPQDDNNYDPQRERLKSRYDRSLNDNSPVIDDLNKSDFLPETAELDEGLDTDANYSTFDSDEQTLPADDPSDVLESGIDEVDLSTDGKDELGDIIIQPEDSLEDDEVLDEILDTNEKELAIPDLDSFGDVEDELEEEDIDE